ncbi:MAG: arginine deiminase-related protein [Paludibacter sp.]
MKSPITNTLLMVEPVAFGFNPETAVNNYFQQQDKMSAAEIQRLALAEFSAMVKQLQDKGIHVIVVKDTSEPHTPDSIFPNNWISFHENGRIVIYPMFAENRRKERRREIIQFIVDQGYRISKEADYSVFEKNNRFLEGTGSMALDRENKIAYAALSERTDKALLLQFCNDFGYRAICFSANQTVEGQRLPVYHTNVMLCVADKYAVICLDSIDDAGERKYVTESLRKTGKEIVEISEKQMHCFAGNMLQVQNQEGRLFLVMSESAFGSLNNDQMTKLKSYNELIVVAVPTIEKYGGGSVRCMMAEVF